MLLKIDLEKAFDRIELSFIHYTLQYFKFPPKFSKLLLNCITTSSIYVIVNGSVTNSFEPTRGIRQGDPISPYIFILCLEMLSRYIHYQVDIMKWDPITTSRKSPKFSHLFFADDLTLMAKANKKSCYSIKEGLDYFSKISWQKINLAKSKILFSKNCPEPDRKDITNILGIRKSEFFGT